MAPVTATETRRMRSSRLVNARFPQGVTTPCGCAAAQARSDGTAAKLNWAPRVNAEYMTAQMA